MRLLLCALGEIPIAFRTDELERMASIQNPDELIIIRAARLLGIDDAETRSDRKLLVLKAHRDTSVEINAPKDIVEIEDHMVHPLPALIRQVEVTPCIEQICIHEGETYCILDSEALIREFRQQKETT